MAKIELLRKTFVRPESRPVIELLPEDVPAFLNTKVPDMFLVKNTPEIAKVCLELNREDNRAVSKHKLAQLTRDQENGNFHLNGDTIKFDYNGRMYDGQKRQKALIMSNTSQLMWWAIGNDPEAHFVTDKGQKRSLGDSLRIEGYTHYTNIAAAGSWLYIIKYCNEPNGLNLKTRLGSDEEVYDLIKRHPDLMNSVAYCHGLLPGQKKDHRSRGQLIPASLMGAIHYLASNFLDKREEAEAFVNTVTKYPLDVAYPHAKTHGPKFYNPVNLWLAWLDDRKKTGISVSREQKGTGTFYVWNLYAEGKRIEQKNFRLPRFSAIASLDLDLI